MAQPRRFPPAWTVEELDACIIVKDSNEQALGYVYYEDERQRRTTAKMLSKDEARRIVVPQRSAAYPGPRHCFRIAAYRSWSLHRPQ